MPNFKLTLAYDGTDFNGWQIQPGQPTIQGSLIEVLEKVLQQPIALYGAGRTDAGVHALGQVANFRADSELNPGDIQRACNAILPPSIRVAAAEDVSEDFHARWSALAKTYRYRVYRGRVTPPFRWRYVHQDSSVLDFVAMEEAAQIMVGEHDFTTFAASTGSEEDDQEREMTRVIYCSRFFRMPDSSFAGADEEWIYEVRGKSFLRYMVRKMVGTLVEVGRGRMLPADIPELFEKRDRSKSGPTMPPQGLCLMKVEYPEGEMKPKG
jgi:tRNA pseudouridine38-40 synthase